MAGSLILDSRGAPMPTPTPLPAPYMMDSVTSAIQQAGAGFDFQNRAMERLFGPQLAYAAYLASGLLQKVIEIPAADRTREWRDWQADQEDIEKLEAEERRLGLIGKIKQAEVLRGIGGGALILAMPGNVETAAVPGAKIAAVNVVSRWQLSLVDLDDNMASERYGQPRMFRMNGGQVGQQDIHPSRVICFTGDPIPAGFATMSEDQFWGQSRLVRLFKEVQRSDHAADWFAALVKKAKLLRIAIPGLTDFTATETGQARLDRRMSAIALGESILGATVTDAGNGKDAPGEVITDFQVTWNGIPAMMDAFDQRVAAVADIPFTRLMGRSPAGMNATGAHDTDNWNKAIAAGQKLELRPCLDQLDAYLMPSAGVKTTRTDPKTKKVVAVTWRFAPLDTPTEAEEASTFDKTMDAVGKLRETGTIPEVAFNKGVQNLMSEREWVPGLDQALAEIPEAERFGIAPDDDGTDPSRTQAEGGDPDLEGAGGVGSAPARRAANDAKPIPLYVQRKLLNADEVIRWAKAQGFKTTLEPTDMHVTVLYSRTPVDPIKMGTTWAGDDKGELTIRPGGPRAIEKLGESAVVLLFASDDLTWRHRGMVEAGASHDFDEYQPHITLTYEAGDVDLDAIKPFVGALRFGPELFEPLDLDWKQKVTEQ